MKNATARHRRIARHAPEPEQELELLASPSPTVEPPEPTARLTVPLTPEGKVDASRLRDKTKESLRRALLDPSLGQSLGVASADAVSDDARVMAQIASGVYDGLSVLAIAMARRAGYSIEAARVLAFTADEKAVLAEPTARVVQKYFPDLGGKYRDELLLAFALTNIIAAKIVLLRESSTHPAVPLAAEPTLAS